MQVKDVMSAIVRTIPLNATVRQAAETMSDADIGALPVQDGDRLAGMITDRDIAIRAIGAGKGPDAKVSEVMSAEVLYCFDDEEIDDVSDNLSDLQVRRLPVLNREKRLVGIVSLADLANNADSVTAGEALEGITRPGGAHSQSVDGRA